MNFVKLCRICCILLTMASFSLRATEQSIEKLAQTPSCARVLEWIDHNTRWVTDQQIRLTEIPAPEWGEASRGEICGISSRPCTWRSASTRSGM